MGFNVQAIESDMWKVVFFDEPEYIHALEMSPQAMEPELKFGTWLVVTFPVWSIPVRSSVVASIACAKLHKGKFDLGVRPFEYYEEMNRWWPLGEVPAGGELLVTVHGDPQRPYVHMTTDTSTDPRWLVLKNGQVVYQGGGPRSAMQLGVMMDGILR